MQRRQLQNRWASEAWEAHSVARGEPGEPVSVDKLLESDELSQYLIRGFGLELFKDEAEGYYLNVSTDAPKVFIMWRREDEAAVAMPVLATVSYGEAARGLDSNENVDAVPMPPDIYAWVAQYVQENYRPEPKKQRHQGDKPSFQSKQS